MRRLVPLLLLLAACSTTTITPPPTPAAEATPPQAVQTAPPCNPGHTILNSVLWVQSSAEFRGAALQTFGAARRALDEALADRTRVGAIEETNADPDQPPAIVTDVDETVLDNTPFEARVVQAGKTYDEKTWKAWTAEGAAPPMPGATELLQYAKSRGVTVFYVTNRDEDERPGTRANLERAGFPLETNVETLLLRAGTSDKSERRRQVADRYRLILLLGDDLNDFANMREASRQDRDALVTKMQSWWGTRWFIMPNPMYGSWERAAIGTGGTPCEQAERKVKVLRP
jgi:acid phosphatase